jgi:hypothetical protein
LIVTVAGVPALTVTVLDAALTAAPAVNARVRAPAVPVAASPANVATPLAFVVAVPLVKVRALPVATDTVTLWLGTGFPDPSVTVTTGTVAKTTPLCTVADGWVLIVTVVGVPAFTVTVLEAALTAAPAVKWSVRAPVTPVAARPVKVATPEPLLVAVPLVKVSAPPVTTDTVTAWLATGFPEPSVTVTTGTVGNTTPLCTVAAGWVLIVTVAGVPALTVTVLDAALTAVPAVNWRVRAPVTPVATKPVNVATPELLVVAVPLVKVRALPVATDTVTAWLDTGFPPPSVTVTTGTVGNTTPLCTVADGWVVIATVAGGPAVRLMEFEVTPTKPPAPKVKVRAPTRPVIERLVKVATPLGLVVALVVPPRLPPPV